jgi:hypothetical protein
MFIEPAADNNEKMKEHEKRYDYMIQIKSSSSLQTAMKK